MEGDGQFLIKQITTSTNQSQVATEDSNVKQHSLARVRQNSALIDTNSNAENPAHGDTPYICAAKSTQARDVVKDDLQTTALHWSKVFVVVAAAISVWHLLDKRSE